MNNKITITAFLPFGSISTNSSLEVVKGISNEYNKEYLDVDWDLITHKIKEIIHNNNEYLILCGQAASYQKVCIEKVAINLKHAKVADNKGSICYNQKINDIGPDAYFSNVDVINLIDRLNNKGINVKLSLSAGSYICNESYYLALDEINKTNSNTKVIFIHFPLYKGQLEKEKIINISESSYNIYDMIQILENIINELLKEKSN